MKIEITEKNETIRNLEVENISLIVQNEEMEKDKIQLSENNRELHVKILNLKIRNEALLHESTTREN